MQKAKKVASVDENQPTGHDIVDSMKAWFKANAPDVTVVEEQYYDIFGTNYDTEVSKALAAKPDVVYMETLGADSYILCDSLWNQGWRGETLGNTGAFNTDEFLRTERDKIEGWCIDVSFSPKVPVTPKTLAYAEAFNTLVGHLPNNHGAQCYDAAYVLFDAIQRAGTFTDKVAVVKALQQTKFTGVRGKDMTFEPGTWQMHFRSLIVQIQKGEWMLVYPTNVAQGPYFPRAQLIKG
jgi:branched-chain amino acid transport system substrate-binding protein